MACVICGKSPGLFDSANTKCRVCGKDYCVSHGKDGKCNICRERLGELKK